MNRNLLLTSCMFQSTPGPHQVMLAQAGFRVTHLRGPLPESELLAALPGHEALMCDTDDVTTQVIEAAAPQLRLIAKVGSSTASIDLDACQTHNVTVLTTSAINHHAVAEQTLALILALSRHIVPHANAIRDGRWRRDPGNELRGRTLGIVGMGRIGREVARLGSAFGMRVAGFGHHWPDSFAEEFSIVRHPSLESLAADADILSLHCRLDADTRHMVDTALLRLMPPGALLVNTSRAGLVDHRAVLAALDRGDLGGYASDVPEKEPPDADDPLILHPNALFSPHVGSFTFQSVPRILIRAVENLIGFFDPKPAGASA